MRKKNSLLLARIIQWISGGIAVIVIYPVFRLICPCWRRIKDALVRRESDAPHDSSRSRSRYSPAGKSIPHGE